jgi:hypothetical protein
MLVTATWICPLFHMTSLIAVRSVRGYQSGRQMREADE